ncbi:MAG: hypothetical protein ACR2KL_12810 [Nocardioidaceae bacterium]
MSQAAGPARGWYAVAALLFVASLLPAFLLARAGVGRLQVPMHAVPQGQVLVGDSQLSVFVSSGAYDRGIGCRLVPLGAANSSPSLALDRSAMSLNLSSGGADYTRVGLIPDAAPVGSYALSCTLDGRPVDPRQLAVGSTAGLAGGALYIASAVIVPMVAALVAVVIAVLVAVLRSRAKRRRLQASGCRPPPAY